jgi:ribosomal protein L24E
VSFLYRAAITITRKQPYIDWANSFDDGGPELTEDLAKDRRTVYLATEADRPELSPLLDEFWEDIFEEELAAWMDHEDDWPKPRTREMFDSWFDAELTDSVFDLVPEQPLTQTDVELADLNDAVHYCAWCDVELEPGAGRFVGFALEDRERVSHREGLVLSLSIDDERVVHGVLSPADSDEARAGEDLVFRVCTSRCEKGLRKAVPKALRKAAWRQDENQQ